MTKLLLLLIAALGMLPGTQAGNGKFQTVRTGTYGVCDCQPGNPASGMIELSLNANNTFHYVDRSDPKKPVDISGQWHMRHSRVVLDGFPEQVSIHNRWRFDSRYNCIRARHYLNFRRLCLVNPCGT